MGEATKIQWCDHTFNPWIGCTKISPGCANCYAAVDTFARTRRSQGVELWGPNGQRHRTSDGYWRQPLKWNKQAALEGIGVRHRVFSASQSDWLEDRPELIPWRADLLMAITNTPHLDWLLLTKRIGLWRARLREIVDGGHGWAGAIASAWLDGEPPKNIWVGASVEDQKCADERIPHLLRTPARVRFLSCEPLLGPISFTSECLIPATGDHPDMVGYMVGPDDGKASLEKTPADAFRRSGIDWAIVGGESGPGARPCDIAWIRSIVRQCRAAGVACFVKQVGALPCVDQHSDKGAFYALLKDPKGGNPEEWPEDLRVREWPKLTGGGER